MRHMRHVYLSAIFQLARKIEAKDKISRAPVKRSLQTRKTSLLSLMSDDYVDI